MWLRPITIRSLRRLMGRSRPKPFPPHQQLQRQSSPRGPSHLRSPNRLRPGLLLLPTRPSASPDELEYIGSAVQKSARKIMKDAPGTRDYDWWLLAILATICALGVVEIYSATHGSSLAGMHMKQVRWLAIGFIAMFALSRLDYHLILDQAPILYLISVAALIAVLAVGHTRFGAKRWIPVLGEFLQVSELVKLIIIIVMARFFAEVRSDELSLRDLIKAGLLVGLPLALILKQPDLGTALVLVPLLVVGAYLGGLQWQHAAIFSLAGLLLIGSVFYPPVSRHILKPYQRERITSFLHPEEDAKGSGYQLFQSKIAVRSGGFWGKGFKHGTQNQLGYIPVRYSDFSI